MKSSPLPFIKVYKFRLNLFGCRNLFLYRTFWRSAYRTLLTVIRMNAIGSIYLLFSFDVRSACHASNSR